MRAGYAVGLVLAVALTGSGPTAAAMNGDPDTGTLAGFMQFGRHDAPGVMRVFHVNGRLVAHRRVGWGHSRFRFLLRPGRYELTFTGGVFKGCPQKGTVRVWANRTTHVGLADACPSGTYWTWPPISRSSIR
jgi:hypothetical protein